MQGPGTYIIKEEACAAGHLEAQGPGAVATQAVQDPGYGTHDTHHSLFAVLEEAIQEVWQLALEQAFLG